MLPLHLMYTNEMIDNDHRLSYIQIGFEYTILCDNQAVIRIPTSLIMPGVLNEGETIYVHRDAWKSIKPTTVLTFVRDNDNIICTRKKTVNAVLKYSTEEHYLSVYGRFIDYDVIKISITDISVKSNYTHLNPEILYNCLKALDYKSTVKLTFYAVNAGTEFNYHKYKVELVQNYFGVPIDIIFMGATHYEE